MSRSNVALVNFAGGVLSPNMFGRADIPLFARSLAICDNFTVLPQGGVQFRSGAGWVHNTRLHRQARYIPFQFNDTDSYLIEATDRKFRFYRNGGTVLESSQTITTPGHDAGDPCVLTVSGHSFVAGDEIYITGMIGSPELNNRYFLVGPNNVNANDFELTDINGNEIDAQAYGTWTSGGTASKVFELTTEYEYTNDVENLQFAQIADTMYIVVKDHIPRKLTRTGHTAWTLTDVSFTSDPFAPGTGTITGISQANPGVITDASHGLTGGEFITIDSVVGMTEINDFVYEVVFIDANTFSLLDRAGTAVDTTAYTAYSSAGTWTRTEEWPQAITFTDDARLMYANSPSFPESIWASRSPSSGTTRYDDFTIPGSPADTDAVIFTLAPVTGKVDAIQFLANTNKQVVIGGFGSIRRLYGSTPETPIKPSAITAKTVNNIGAEDVLPVSLGTTLFYIQRGGRLLRSFEYDIQVDDFTTVNRNLVADHLGVSQFKRIVQQQSNAEVLWVLRSDGILLGQTFVEKEGISGWHRHNIGGPGTPVIEDIGIMPRATEDDQLWLLVKRTINGVVERSVEFLDDIPIFPERDDFFTNFDPATTDSTETADDILYRNALFEKQKDGQFLDMAHKYDGSTVLAATMTPGATTGTSISFTAGSGVLTADHVTHEIWKKYDAAGGGGGRAVITGFTNSTTITCDIVSDFDNTDAIAAGDWFITAKTLYGLDILEGETIQAITDGSVHPDVTVTNGQVTLNYEASKVHLGYKRTGIIKTLNIDIGSRTGPASAKPRNITRSGVRFLHALSAKVGSTLYNAKQVLFRSTRDKTGRPPPLFSGVKEQSQRDFWSTQSKSLTVLHDQALPCTILGFEIFADTVDSP